MSAGPVPPQGAGHYPRNKNPHPVLMTAERWKRIRAVFQIAAGLPPGRREAYLEEACDGEPELRREVESLLTASGGPERSDLQQSAASLIESLQNPFIGRRVGNYQVTGEVGRGGMG